MIKIERPGGGDFARSYDTRVRGLSSHFVWTNRSKESLALDVKHPDGASRCSTRWSRAPTCWCRTSPRARARGSASTTRRCMPRIRASSCATSRATAATGPYRDRKAYDLLIQSESGFLSVTGTPDEPAKAGCSIADIAAGMYAYSAILAALIQRGRTGEGAHIDIAMLESMAEWMSFPLYYAFDGAAPPPRIGAAHATIYPYGPFTAGDGRTSCSACRTSASGSRSASDVLRPARARARPALRLEPERTRAACTAAGDHRGGVRAADRRRGASRARRRPDRQRARQRHAGRCGRIRSSPRATAGARWTRRPGRCPRWCRPACRTAWMPRMDAVPALAQHTDAILARARLRGVGDRAVASHGCRVSCA